MAWSDSVTTAMSPYVTAGFALAGSLIGGAIAGTVSLVVARQAREAAASSWIRDNRREMYDRFLTKAQELLLACYGCKYPVPATEAAEPPTTEAAKAVERAFNSFFEAYGVVQTVAERSVLDAARIYAWRLMELRYEALGDPRAVWPDRFVAALIEPARHATIDAMRTELGLAGTVRHPHDFNPFAGTALEEEWTAGSEPATP